jgi:hypothetical protein
LLNVELSASQNSPEILKPVYNRFFKKLSPCLDGRVSRGQRSNSSPFAAVVFCSVCLSSIRLEIIKNSVFSSDIGGSIPGTEFFREHLSALVAVRSQFPDAALVIGRPNCMDDPDTK